MIRLTTFGGPGLCDDDGKRIDSVLAQPRRLALLIYLAVEGRKTRVRRDVVLGTFWPEVDQARASRSLSQSMFFLRKSLGSVVLTAPGCEDLGVNERALSCDACAFLTALESGHNVEALALYHGDFLRGFFLDDAPEFEDWLEAQRSYMRRRATEAAMAEARAAAARTEAVAAAAMARRASELGLFAEPLVREQMELLGSLGDYSGALAVYEQLRRHLRQELDIEPSPESRRVANELRARAAAAALAPAFPSHHDAVTPPIEYGPAAGGPRRRRFRSAAVAGIAAVVCGGVAFFLGLSGNRRAAAPIGAPVLLIDDFVEVGSVPRGSGAALVADVVGKLSIVPGLAAKYLASPLVEPGSSPQGPGRLVLRGSVTRQTAPSRYQVSLALSNGMTGEGVAHHVLTYDSVHFAALDRVSDDIADLARREAGRFHDVNQLARGDPASAAAIRLAQRYRVMGDSLRSEGRVGGSLDAFQAADSILRHLPGSRRAAAVLVERGEIWVDRAWIFFTPEAYHLGAFRRSMETARALATAAVRADSSAAAAHEVRGVALHFLWQTESADSGAALQRLASESEAAFRTAVTLAPARARSWALLSASLYHRGRYQDARLAAERAYAANAYLEEASDLLQKLVSTSLETDDPAAAERWCAEIGRRHANSWAHADCQLQLKAWLNPTAGEFRHAAETVRVFRSKSAHLPTLVARLEMLLGVVAARTGLPADSALAIQTVALRRSPQDPELAPIRAWLWQSLNRPDSARMVLGSYVRTDPVRRAGISNSKRFLSEPVLAVH